ncbi:hypothetical protein ABTY98_41590 [Streptomyces sp. NPDC096040]|uniref:hypothetical protein n=1 Tax=Streptomyces sp. NPDC096040 TaxID=3155541 RepID=UPI003319E1B6
MYAQFLACAVETETVAGLSHVQSSRHQRWVHRVWQRTPVQSALADLQRALAEVELVGNVEPVEAALQYSSYLKARTQAEPVPERKPDPLAHIHLRDRFIQACRRDLLYVPRWWQVWRPVLWDTWGRASRERRRLGKTVRSLQRRGELPKDLSFIPHFQKASRRF